ncbi:MAG: hypothetical protein D6748_07320 [Calditrichaeota bacterium]|nr:MAG: hypothetical protein D6748_07320 [Calditrichota bacterium]
MVEMYYKRIVRFVEYYIFFCFVLITVIPLLEYSWVQPFTRFIYFTGFPLLLLLLIVSLVRDPLIEFLKRKYETSEQPAREKTTRKK